MGNFNWTIFLHAGYVAFVYACIAFGATAYRQIIDELDVKRVRLGEDLFFAYDPQGILIIMVLCVFFLTFAGLALYVFPLETRYYVIPLAFAVNIIQLSFRYYRQRLIVKTQGIIGRGIYREKFDDIAYTTMTLVEVEDNDLWYYLTVHYNAASTEQRERQFHCRLSGRMLPRFLQTLQSLSPVKTVIKEKQPKVRYE